MRDQQPDLASPGAGVVIVPGSKLTFGLVQIAAVDPLDDPAAPDKARVVFYLDLLAGQPTAHLGLLLVEPVHETGRYKLLDGHHRHEAYRQAGRAEAAAVAIEKPESGWPGCWVVP